jgi:S-DNA-T family DNA segregation ATPase FtsK/SpoIIIE
MMTALPWPAVAVAVLLPCLAALGFLSVRVRCFARELFTYRFGWNHAMSMCGLTVTVRPRKWSGGQGEKQTHAPRIGAGLRCRPFIDRVPVLFVSGQTLDQWRDAAPALASAFRANSCRVRASAPGTAVLEFSRGDPLQTIIPALPISEALDLAAVPVGLREDGTPWSLRLLGSHLLIAGTTGAGKGSVIWGLLRGVAPAIRDGLVQVWAVDPKGGMELSPGEALFTRFAHENVEAMLGLLEDAVRLLDARAARLRGITRLHQPSFDDPLVLVVVDELLTLTSYGVDTTAKRRAASALGSLLSRGRAVGVLVMGAVQDPRKESLPFRDLFPTRVALRLQERDTVDLVLGDGAWKAGARCDDIPLDHPGVGYVLTDGHPDPVRVRAAHVTDADIALMVTGYAPGSYGSRSAGWTP